MPLRSRTTLVVGALALTVTISLVLAAGLPGRQAYRFLSVFHEVWNLTRANYVEPVSEESLLDGAYRGMLASLDAASAYLPPGEETGILEPSGPGRTGLEVLPSGGVPIVVRVDPDTPADRAGIQPGDQIWRIGGSSARQLSWPQLRRRMTGQAGAALDLSVLDGRTFRVRTVSLALEVPKDPGFTIERVPGGVAHLRLRSLERVDPNVLASRLKTGLAEGGAASSLLVDLRGSVGLDLRAAARALSVLVPEGVTWRLETREGVQTAVEVPKRERIPLPSNLFVLVDGSTAGSAEAVAVALEERAGGRLCGRETFGLGAVPEIIPLTRGGSLLLTTRAIVSADGTRWAGDGLDPDRVLTPSLARAEDRDRDRLLEEALSWIRAGAPAVAPDASLRPAARLEIPRLRWGAGTATV